MNSSDYSPELSGIFRHIGIEKVAATLSIAAMEGSFDMTGLPSFPSYVPGKQLSKSINERIVQAR